MIQRHVLVAHEAVDNKRRVRGYLLFNKPTDEVEEDLLNDAKRKLVFGDEDDGSKDLSAEGDWFVLPETPLVGDDWFYVNGSFTRNA